jgi:hypothetical protein
MVSSFTRFHDHTQRRTTVGRTALDEWSARLRDLYLTTHATNIHAPGGIRTHERSRRAATGTGTHRYINLISGKLRYSTALGPGGTGYRISCCIWQCTNWVLSLGYACIAEDSHLQRGVALSLVQ